MIGHNVISLCKPYYNLHCKPLHETWSLVLCKQVQIVVVVGEFFILNNPPKWISVLHSHSRYNANPQYRAIVQLKHTQCLSAMPPPPSVWSHLKFVCQSEVRCHFISLLLLLNIIYPGYIWFRWTGGRMATTFQHFSTANLFNWSLNNNSMINLRGL